MRIRGALIVLALAVAAAQPAAAAVTAPFISGTYYEQNGERGCGSLGSASVSICRLVFDPPPRGKQILIDRVSCSLFSRFKPLAKVYLAVGQNGADARKLPIEPILMFSNSTPDFHFLLNDDVDGYLVTTAPRIVMELASAGAMKLDCQITGRVAKKP